MSEHNLRILARSLFDTAVAAADPALAVRRELTADPLDELAGGRYLLLAIGKAACAMADEALRHLPADTPYDALAVTNPENIREVPGCEIFAASHPVPDERGLCAAMEVRRRLLSAQDGDVVLCLISGGGSALLPLPPPEIPLADKIKVNELLLERGFDIYQTNLVRQQLSQLKGGKLALLASPAHVRSLIISDVIGDEPSCIASGPTAASLGSPAEAIQLLKNSNVWQNVPDSVQTYLSRNAEAVPITLPPMLSNRIIGSNRQSLEAIMAAAPQLSPVIVTDRLCGDVGDAAEEIIDQIMAQPRERQLLIWGGETTVEVIGNGRGGRNQELAMHIAMMADPIEGRWVFLSGGTDGRDGPTDAAGGIVDSATVQRIDFAGEDAYSFLLRNDSYNALAVAGDLLLTGATGTNVGDIQLFLRDA